MPTSGPDNKKAVLGERTAGLASLYTHCRRQAKRCLGDVIQSPYKPLALKSRVAYGPTNERVHRSGGPRLEPPLFGRSVGRSHKVVGREASRKPVTATRRTRASL